MLDSCAAVTEDPNEIYVIVQRSRCRIITAFGNIVENDGVLCFLWKNPHLEEFFSVDSELLIREIGGAKDWLLRRPVLGENGFND